MSSEIKFPSPTALLGPSANSVTSSTLPLTRPLASPKATSSQSGNAKRKAPPTKSKQPKIKADPVNKPKQSKSRNGCVTCKSKRLKCDETKPTCQQCAKRQVPCEGYRKDWKWKEFNESMVINKAPAPAKPKKAPARQDFPTPSSQSPTASEGTGSTVTPNTLSDTPKPVRPLSPVYSPPNDDIQHQSPRQESQIPQPEPVRSHRPFPLDLSMQDVGIPSTTATGLTPSLADLCLPPHMALPIAPSFMSRPGVERFVSSTNDTDNFSSRMNAPSLSEFGMYGVSEATKVDSIEDEDIEEVLRTPSSGQLTRQTTMTSFDSSTGFPEFEIPEVFLNRQPSFDSHSPENLMKIFHHSTCGVLSMRDGELENPWRNLIYPLVKESPALFHAIASMAAFHSSKHQRDMKVKALEHRAQSIELLHSGIQDMRPDIAIAITLVLAFAESWDSDFAVSTGIHHLQGAKSFLNSALSAPLLHDTPPEISNRTRFLCNTWVYMDVIARLTTLESDDSEDFNSALSTSYKQFGGLHEVDPLMGCASTMFPLIGRVANLVRRVRSRSTNSIQIIQQAGELKRLLDDWSPPYPFSEPDDEQCDLDAALQTAEAYRWATLLYLHQAVPEIPSRTSGQLAKKALIKLALVPLHSRTIIVQIYPLLAAGCEASSGEDREWVSDRWDAMSRIMNIGNIDRCQEVVREVWDRRDVFDIEMRRLRENRRSGSSGSGRGGVFNSPPGRSAFMAAAPTAGDVQTDFGAWGLASLGRGGPGLADRDVDMLGGASSNSHSSWQGQEQGRGRREHVDPESLSPGDLRRHRPSSVRRERSESRETRENMLAERTVRGRQHWIGVMKDWNWEVE